MEGPAKKRAQLCQTAFAKERCNVFKNYMREAVRVSYLTFPEPTPKYHDFVKAIYYKIILRSRVSNMTSWFCTSCFSFTTGTKQKHLDLGHPEEDTKSSSVIYKELEQQGSSETFATYLQKAAQMVPKTGLEVKPYSLPSVNRSHDREERMCCKEADKQLQDLREQVQSLTKENEKLRQKAKEYKQQRDLANCFAAMNYQATNGLDLRWDRRA
jgi:hypothetical protein